MITVKKIYRDILLPGAFYFTLLTLIAMIAAACSDSDLATPALRVDHMVRLLVFSLIFAWSNRLFYRKNASYRSCLFFHFLAFLGNITVSLLFGNKFVSSSGPVIMLVLFALVYVIFATIGTTMRHFVVKDKDDKKMYKRQFR